MNNSIQARQIHWHLLVLVLDELKTVYATASPAVQGENYNVKSTLVDGVAAAHNLIAQEDWNPAMPAYPSTKEKLDRMIDWWHRLPQPAVMNSDRYKFTCLRNMLTMTQYARHRLELLRISIRFDAQ